MPLWIFPNGVMLLLTTLSLSPNMCLSLRKGTPKHRKVMRRSNAYSTQVLDDENSEPCVAVSTVDCFLLHQSTGVLFNMFNNPVTDLPVMTSRHKFAS